MDRGAYSKLKEVMSRLTIEAEFVGQYEGVKENLRHNVQCHLGIGILCRPEWPGRRGAGARVHMHAKAPPT